MLCGYTILGMILGFLFGVCFLAVSAILHAFGSRWAYIVYLVIGFVAAVVGVGFGTYHETGCQ